MKISIIGAGNVGGLTAMRLAQKGLGDIFLVDIAKGLAQAKAFDMEDAQGALGSGYRITGSDDTGKIKGSDIVVVTAGLPRKPGMTREDLLNKNAQILKEVCLNIKRLSPQSIVIIVTNPLDLMTRFALEVTGFSANKILGMGITLDASRFANLISKELGVPVTDIDACVIGSHGEGMLPMPRFTKVKGESLDKILNEDKLRELTVKTVDRGKEIVALLGSGSAYFAPSAAITELVAAITGGSGAILGVSAYLNGEYGIKDVCMGVPCRLGKSGIEKIVELELNQQEMVALQNCAIKFKEQYKEIR